MTSNLAFAVIPDRSPVEAMVEAAPPAARRAPAAVVAGTTPDAAASPKPHALTRLEIGAILAIIVVWGVNNAAGKLATESLPPLLVGALRFAIATVCLVGFVRPPFPDWKSLLLIVLVAIFAPLLGTVDPTSISPARRTRPAPRPGVAAPRG